MEYGLEGAMSNAVTVPWQYGPKAWEAESVSGQISLDEPSFLLFISITSHQVLVHTGCWALVLTQERFLWVLMLQDLLLGLKTEISGGQCIRNLEYQKIITESILLLGSCTL